MNEKNQTLERALQALIVNKASYHLVKYPAETGTVKEKAGLLGGLFPSQENPIPVVQGSLLEYENAGRITRFLYVHDRRIQFRKLRREVGIGRDTDVGFYQGNLHAIAGIQEGEVSPFLPNLENIVFIAFSSSLLESAQRNPEQKYEFAITRKSGILVNPFVLYQALREVLGEKMKEVKHDGNA